MDSRLIVLVIVEKKKDRSFCPFSVVPFLPCDGFAESVHHNQEKGIYVVHFGADDILTRDRALRDRAILVQSRVTCRNFSRHSIFLVSVGTSEHIPRLEVLPDF